MNLGRAAKIAEDELAKAKARYPQLEGWRFAWNKRRTSFGLCRYTTRTVELSIFLTDLEIDESQVADTVRHEIAHALAGAEAKHGPEWQRWARRLGAIPMASRRGTEHATDLRLPARYALVVTIDGEEHTVRRYHRRPPQRFVESLPKRWLVGRPETKGRLRLKLLAT